VHSLQRIKNIIPSLKSPTVVPLAEAGMVAVHSVIAEDVFWDVMEKLKAAGASGIIVIPIETIIR
jgi:ATP phosphoribosyltransferase